MRDGRLPELGARVYLIFRIPKLRMAASESPKELAESSDAKVLLPE